MLASPAEPLKIDWAAYKNKIAVPGMVDNFEKSYNAVQIPYPEDKYTAAVEKYGCETVRITDVARRNRGRLSRL